MAEKKSILESALLDIKNIQSALNANTKEILRSVAKEEIDSVVKESLTKEVYEEEDLDQDPNAPVDLGGDADAATADIEGGTEEVPSTPEGGLDDIEGSQEVAPVADPAMGGGMEPELGMDASALGGDEMDMTAASDDDVIAIYKKLSGEDEIEIVGDEIHLNVSEPGEYVIKSNEGGAPAMGGAEMGDDDVQYDIEMGDEGGADAPADLAPVDGEEGGEGEEASVDTEEPVADDTEAPVGDEDDSEGDEEQLDEKISIGTGMSVGTHRNPKTGGSIGAQENPKSKMDESKTKATLVSETTKKYNTLLVESKKLKAENEDFRKALKEFRTKLVETVVFNSNLTYVTRLFMEHSTTKGEKQNIIKRFDEEVSNLKESKKLYKTIANELDNRKPISESVENKITKEVNTGASKQLTESTAYVDPSAQRIRDLINRVENR